VTKVILLLKPHGRKISNQTELDPTYKRLRYLREKKFMIVILTSS
jgi:hypothetical protein